jgi:hypothetical protein
MRHVYPEGAGTAGPLTAWLTDFQRFWTYQYADWARRFLRDWCTRTMRSGIDPTKRVARMLRDHENLIMSWFKARETISAGLPRA